MRMGTKAAAWAVALSLGPLAGSCEKSDSDTNTPENVSATVSPTISTVVQVSWTTESESTGYVEYGPTEALGQRTPLEAAASTEHSVALLGLKAGTPYFYRVVIWDGDEAAASSIQTVETGFLPTVLPSLTLQGGGHEEYTLVPLLGTTTAATIIDGDGDIVWYHIEDRDLDVYRVRLANDGESILYNAGSVSGDPADNSELVRVPLDGSPPSSIPLSLLAHDFVELPDGTMTAIVVEYRDVNGVQVRGDRLVEVAPDGTQTQVWSAWDCFDPALHPVAEMAHGWTFANALDYDPTGDVYYLGMRNFSSITRINRQTGACEWVLGQTASTLTFAPGTLPFLHQHQFQMLENGHLLVFDNEGSPGNISRVVEYQLDLVAGTATQVWDYTSDPTVYTFVLGEPTRMAGGDTFVNWSAAGQLERVGADGTSKWKLNSGAGYAFGFNTLETSLYP
ncbi:MAG: hypothetical protein B7733_04415 [Myxococcales bacterium FL481]|nr:MAG: hypothetical protein B7733_04415 [Myxococcales bacterium FL481]